MKLALELKERLALKPLLSARSVAEMAVLLAPRQKPVISVEVVARFNK
jgi:hypothetical protein